MFSMIITIVSIALVAILAMVTIYYGAQYVKDGNTRTAVAKALQEGNQIVGAFELYRADHEKMPEGDQSAIIQALLNENYLTTWPGTKWGLQTDYAVRAELDNAQCLEVNRRMGIETIPKCDDASIGHKTYCCTLDAPAEGDGS